jgi:uncharacterized phage-associated protein
MTKEEAVANFFIALGHSDGGNGEYMTNMRLNKLMYFAQAWSLVLFDKPLFSETIKAWEHGPVIPSIYHKYRRGRNPIVRTDPSFSIDMLDAKEQELLLAVIAKYGIFSTYRLRNITHRPGSPWESARTGNKIIEIEKIKEYFKKEDPLKLIGSGEDYPTVGYRSDCGSYVLPTDWK